MRLLLFEVVNGKVVLQSLVGVIDTQLLQTVAVFKALEAVEIQNACVY